MHTRQATSGRPVHCAGSDPEATYWGTDQSGFDHAAAINSFFLVDVFVIFSSTSGSRGIVI
eukprot:3150637-Pyramimonas_sp.AAC.1